MKRIVGRLGLLSVSIALCLGAAEVGLRALGYEAIYDVYSKPSVLWRKDSQLGWHHQPNHRELYVGPRPFPVEFETPIEINSLGLRGPEVGPRDPQGKRVLFLGDSVVAGFEVPYEQTFVHRVAEPLSRELGVPVQTINGGVRGYGTDQGLLWFKRRGRALQPDLVLFIHSINDPRNNMTLHRPRRPFGKPAFALRGDVSLGSLELLGTPVPDYPLCWHVGLDEAFEVQRMDGWLSRSVCNLETRLADHSALFTLVTLRLRQNPLLLQRLRDIGSPAEVLGWFGPRPALAAPARRRRHYEPQHALTSRLLLELAREVRRSGAQLLVSLRDVDLERMDTVAIRAEGARLELINLPEDRELERAVHWVNDGHYNAYGHELAARALVPELAKALREAPEARRPGAPGFAPAAAREPVPAEE